MWGVATSSFQIEGSTQLDGRGESIWDRFAARPGSIEDGSDASVACDHYRRWEQDLALLTELGVGAYRFSIAWPRIFPSGAGRLNDSGFAFYDRLVDGLLMRNIEPFATLYHWDLPQGLQDRGGWQNRDTASFFAEYVFEVTRRLGDRVNRWITHNEPWCTAILGHEIGEHAPGLKNRRVALAAGHHILLSHGLAVRALREAAPRAEVGIVQNVSPAHAASPSVADIRATRQVDEDRNRWFIEPVALGQYPVEAVDRYRDQGLLDETHPVLARPTDLDVIATPTDFLGINYYSRVIVRADIDEIDNLRREIPPPTADRKTDMGVEAYPAGLYEALTRAASEWKASKLYITECGCAYDDRPGPDGRIADQRRIRFLDAHFDSMHRAIEEGAPVAGLFVWSLMDNFEWAHGYTKRFGIVWTDYSTQERCLKDSARWFRQVVREHGQNEGSEAW